MSGLAVAQEAEDENLDALFALSEEGPEADSAAAEQEHEPLETIPVGDDEDLNADRNEKDSRTIDEIVVTATKREESARDIPASIDAFSGEDLTDRGASGFEDYIKFSPGVSFNAGRGSDNHFVSIRGVTTESFDSLVGSFPTGLFLDDIPLMNPSIVGARPEIDAFDLATVEILKGPQGTLFGGSALAGAVRFVPQRPDLEQAYGSLLYAAKSPAHSDRIGHDAAVMLNAPMNDELGVRLVAASRAWPGVVDDLRRGIDDVDRSRNILGRAMVRWQPLQALTVDAEYHRVDVSAEDLNFVDNRERWERESTAAASPLDSVVDIYKLQFGYDFDGFTLSSISSLVAKDRLADQDVDRAFINNDTGGVIDTVNESNTITTKSFANSDSWTQEIRLVSQSLTESSLWLLDGWEWLGGAFYQQADQFRDNQIFGEFTPGVPDPLTAVIPTGTSGLGTEPESRVTQGIASAVATETAVFFDIIRMLGPQWRLNIGGRYFRQVTEGLSITKTAESETQRNSATLEEAGFNPKLALTWHATSDIDIYSSLTRGFRFGGVNNLNPVFSQTQDIPPFYESDELWNYELGVRTNWLDDRLRADVTGFLIDWSRLQILQRTDDGLSAFIDNVGGATNKGVEGAVRALLPWQLTATVNASYIDARITTPFQSSGTDIPAGQRLPATPQLQAAAILGHAATLGDWQIDSQLSYAYHGSSFSNLTEDIFLPSYELVDLSFNIDHAAARYIPKVAVIVKNVFDRQVVVNGLNSAGSNPDFLDIVFNRPRTLTLQLTSSF